MTGRLLTTPVWFYTIYAIIGPDGRCRYVGCTSKRLETRMRGHRRDRTPVGDWVRRCGGRARIVRLERVTDRRRGERERHWIGVARRAGRDLFNVLPRAEVVAW